MNRVRIYVSAVVAAALITGIAVYSIAPGLDVRFVWAALWLSGISVGAMLLGYQLPGGALGSIGFIPVVATALLVPNWIAVAAVACSNLLTEFVTKKEWFKRAFNGAQVALSTALAILVYRGLGGRSLLDIGAQPVPDIVTEIWLPLLAMVFTFVAANTLAVSGAIAIDERKSVIRVWRHNHLGAIVYDLFASPAVFLLAWLYARFGPAGAALLTLPLLGVRQLYKTNRQLENVNQELLELMVKAIEARDPYTSGHSRRVAHYSRLIARAVGLNSKQIERIGVAALLHDVGKIHEVYAPILQKPDKLTADEWAIMQTHPIKSADLVSTVSQLRDIVGAVRHHHENWDGNGYPDGLAGDAIPLASRIILFADTIDAMTTDRPYRKAMTEAQVRAELLKHKGKQFDPAVCESLLASPMFGLLFSPAPREMTPDPATVTESGDRRQGKGKASERLAVRAS